MTYEKQERYHEWIKRQLKEERERDALGRHRSDNMELGTGLGREEEVSREASTGCSHALQVER